MPEADGGAFLEPPNPKPANSKGHHVEGLFHLKEGLGGVLIYKVNKCTGEVLFGRQEGGGCRGLL